MINLNSIPWISPKLVKPGQVVLVHFLWNPFNESSDWTEIPPHPFDVVHGFWAPVPRLPSEAEDPALDNLAVMMKAVANLFQEDSEYLVLNCMGEDFLIPWDQPYIVALVPE